jgi:hypothetical protein
MTRYQSCTLCGTDGPQVEIRMVEWANPMPKRFDVIPACIDARECRQRVEQQGEAWPLAAVSRDRVAS